MKAIFYPTDSIIQQLKELVENADCTGQVIKSIDMTMLEYESYVMELSSVSNLYPKAFDGIPLTIEGMQPIQYLKAVYGDNLGELH